MYAGIRVIIYRMTYSRPFALYYIPSPSSSMSIMQYKATKRRALPNGDLSILLVLDAWETYIKIIKGNIRSGAKNCR